MDSLKVFVGGLSQFTTKESLNAYFGQFGLADSFIMLDKATGRSRGFGFVNFADESTVQTVLSLNHEVDGQPVTVSAYQSGGKGGGGGGGGYGDSGNSYVDSSSSHPSAPSLQFGVRPAATRDQLKIFVGGLSQSTTRESLSAYFQQFGFADAFIMLDRTTGRSRGFGFVNFQDEAVMSTVLAMNHEVDGSPITVSAYADRGSRSGGGGSYGSGSTGGGGYGCGGGATSTRAIAPAGAPPTSSSSTALAGTFAAAAGGGDQNATNSLLVLLQTPQISSLLQKVQAQATTLLAQLAGGSPCGAAGAATLASLSPAPAGPSSPLKIFVGGLAQHTTKESLRSYFQQFGQADAIVMMDKATGRSRGFGFVDFVDEGAVTTVLQYSHEVDGTIVTCTPYTPRGGAEPVFAPAPAPAPPAQQSVADIIAAALGQLGSLKAPPGGGLGNGNTRAEVVDAAGFVPGKLFVANLTQSITSQHLSEVFSVYGPCECEVVIDRTTGRSRGFGFVRYTTEGDMRAALSNVHVVQGVAVEVSECWGKSGTGSGGRHRSSPY